MYKVYADDVIIHDSRSPSDAIHLIDPVLTMGDSVAGSFDFTAPDFNPGYSSVSRWTTTIKVQKENETIWTGRVVSESEDFFRRRKFSCEGALSYLNDSYQLLNYIDNASISYLFRQLISNHNNRVNENRRFDVGIITVHDNLDSYNYKTEYKSTWDTIKELLFDQFGGHIRVRYSSDSTRPIIDYLEDYPNTSPQEINFGDNLLDFTRNWDLSNLCTVIIPRGKQSEEENDRGDREYLTIASVNNGSIYLQNTNAVNKYGFIERTVDFSDEEDATNLKKLGTTYLSNLQFDSMILKVSAVDLHYIDPSITGFNLLDEVRCVSPPHGLDKMFPITEISIPLDKPDGITYTMGSENTISLSSSTASTAKSFEELLKYQIGDTLADAKRNAALIINQKTTGYVNIITEGECSQSLVITNTPDIETATKLWRFNMNGLGYSKDSGETYELAITMDGTIVADFIRTGAIDDGHGYNRWNLATGEFQFAYNNEFVNSAGQSITIVDVVDLAQSAQDSADLAQDSADVAQDTAALAQHSADEAGNRRSGGDNILTGTNTTMKMVTGTKISKWTDGTWDGRMGAEAIIKIINASKPPNAILKKAVNITPLSSSNVTTMIVQRDISIAESQVYTMSCYAKGSGKILLRAGSNYKDSDFSTSGTTSMLRPGSMWAITSTGVLTSNWKRYSFTFKTGTNNWGDFTTKPQLAGVRNNTICVCYGLVGNNSNAITICGMKMERGNTASDWTEASPDVFNNSVNTSNNYTNKKSKALETYTKKYVKTISDSDREFTKNQRKALDTSFNQRKVLQRLTNNFQSKGIYLQQNELYMNASYVRTGTLDAGIIKAGILTDARGINKWNMATGYLYTKNMEAHNMLANGTFECGSYYKMQMQNGVIHGYQDTTWVGSISPTATLFSIPEQRYRRGLQLRAEGTIDIRTPKLSILDANSNGTSIFTYTGTFSFDAVERIDDLGDGAIRWYTVTHNIQIINGLVVAIA